jgi:hypothetical protein
LPRFACYCHIPRSTKEYEHAKIEPRTQKHLKFAVPPAIATSAAGSKLALFGPSLAQSPLLVLGGDMMTNEITK